MGHADIKMTMRYAHLSKEFARQEIQNLNGLTSRKVKKEEAATAMTAPSSRQSDCHKSVTTHYSRHSTAWLTT